MISTKDFELQKILISFMPQLQRALIRIARGCICPLFHNEATSINILININFGRLKNYTNDASNQKYLFCLFLNHHMNELKLDNDFQERKLDGQIHFQIESNIHKKVVKPKPVEKKHVNYLNGIKRLYKIYLKILLGRSIDDKEYDHLCYGLGEHPHRDRKKFPEEVTNKIDLGLNYLNEFDLHMGDVVISFPNPDHPDTNMPPLEPQDALKLCQESFCHKASTDSERLDNQITMKAIEEIYYQLDDRVQYLQKRKIHKRKRIIESKESEQDDLEEEEILNKQKDLYSAIMESPHVTVGPLKSTTTQKPPKQIHPDKELTVSSNYQLLRGQKETTTRLERYNNDMIFSYDVVDSIVDNISNKLLRVEKLDIKAKQIAVKESFQLDNERIRVEKPRIMVRGYYLIKQLYGNQIYFTDDDSEDQARKWTRSKYDTSDFLTLVRNATILQLTKQGFVSRQFLSEDGKQIFVVLYQTEQNLKLIAVRNAIPKKLNFQFTDLLSLEPVDGNRRPLRLSNRLWRIKEYTDSQVTPCFKYLRPKLMSLIQEINFKLIAREMNISQQNTALFVYAGPDQFDDEVGPTDSEWESFYQYLIFLKEEVLAARARYHFGNEESILINNQKSAFGLYIQTNKEHRKQLYSLSEDDIEQVLAGRQNQEIEDEKSKHLRKIVALQLDLKKIQEQFKEVRTFLHYPQNKRIGTKQFRLCRREKLATDYLHIFQEGLKMVNLKRKMLKTVWDYLDVDPLEIYIGYTVPTKDQNYSTKARLNQMWRKYQITETGRVSIFSFMERMKLTNQCMDEKLNFNTLLQTQFVTQYFCLNNDYELWGASSEKYFEPLMKKKFQLNQILIQENYYFLHKQLTEILKIESGYRVIPPDIHIQMNSNIYDRKEFQFVEPKLYNLAFQWRFQIKNPWKIPTSQIREYYGEKIALYFNFLGYYTYMLVPIGLVGLGLNIYQIYVWDNYSPYYIYPTMGFGFFQVHWVNMLFQMWQAEEIMFGIKYGQNKQGGGEQTQNKRADFEGDYVRSIENDQLNAIRFPDIEKYKKFLKTISIQLLILLVYFGIVIGLLYISQGIRQLYYADPVGTDAMSIILLEVTIPATINVILMLFCDDVYEQVADQLTKFENHETSQGYEANYIFKKYFLCFMSICGPMTEILFVLPLVGMRCATNDCTRHCKYYFGTVFLWQITIHFVEVARPVVKKQWIKYKKLQAKKQKDEASFVDSPDQSELSVPIPKLPKFMTEKDQSIDLLHFCHVEVDGEVGYSQNPFRLINEFIESEAQKASYALSPDRYGTVNDYMQLCLQYSMIALCGATFPMSFFISFLWGIVEIQTDKHTLLKETQRPLPLNENTIGIWNGVLEILSYGSLLQNTALLTYQSELLKEGFFGFPTLAFFLMTIVINFALSFVEASVFGDKPFNIIELLKRHRYVLKSSFEKFRGSSTVAAKDDDLKTKFMRFPIYIVWGCKLPIIGEQKIEDEYASESSMSDLDDKLQYLPEDIKKMEHTMRVMKKKKLEETYEDLVKKQKSRRSHWALKLRFRLQTDPVEQARSLRQQEKTLRYLRKMELITSYKKLWTDERLSTRRLFLRRKLLLLRNLDWRRILMFREDQAKLRIKFEKKMRNKYEWKALILEENLEDQQSRDELQEIINNAEAYIQKHQFLASRKIIAFRLFGVCFNQFRKTTLRKTPLRMLQEFKRLTEYQKRQALKGLYRAPPPTAHQLLHKYVQSKTETQIKQFNFKDFLENLNRLIPPDRLKFNYTYSTNQPKEIEYIIDDLKTVAQRRQCRFDQEILFGLRKESEELCQLMYLCEQQTITTEDEFNRQYKLRLVKLLENKKNTIRCNNFGFYSKPDTLRWLVFTRPFEDSSKVQGQIRLQDQELMYFTQISLSQVAYPEIFSKVAGYYNSLTFIKPQDISGLPVALLKYVNLIQSDPLDKVDDVFLKGYLIRIFKPPRGNLALGQTLREVISNRASKKIEYSDNHITEFIFSTLKALQNMEVEHKMFHGGISPSQFYLVGEYFPQEEQAGTLILVDAGFYYWYDYEKKNTEFLRVFSELSEDGLFAPPELLHNFRVPGKQVQLNPNKCDVYSLGLVVLEMMTLGKMTQRLLEIGQKETHQNGENMQSHFEKFFQSQQEKLSNLYPKSFPILLQMLEKDITKRPLPSQLTLESKEEDFKDHQIPMFQQPFYLNQEKLESAYAYLQNSCIIPLDIPRMHKDYGDYQQMEQGGNQNYVNLNDFLKISLHRISTLFKMRLLRAANQASEAFEQQLTMQFFKTIPFQDEALTFFESAESFLIHFYSEILQEPNYIKILLNLIQYFLLKLELLNRETAINQSVSLGKQIVEMLSKFIKVLESAFDELGVKTDSKKRQRAEGNQNIGYDNDQMILYQNQVQTLVKLIRKKDTLEAFYKTFLLRVQTLQSQIGSMMGNILYLSNQQQEALDYAEAILGNIALELHMEQKGFRWHEKIRPEDKKPDKPEIAAIIGKPVAEAGTKVAAVSQGFVYRLCQLIDLKYVRVKLYYDLHLQNDYIYAIESINRDIRLLRRVTKNKRIKTIDPSDSSALIISRSDFSNIPQRFTNQVMEYTKIIFTNCKKMNAKHDLGNFDLDSISLKKFKKKQPRCQLFKLMNMPVRRILFDVSLARQEDKDFNKYLNHLYKQIVELNENRRQVQQDIKGQGVFKLVVDDLMTYHFVYFWTYFKYLPARKIKNLADIILQVTDADEPLNDGLHQLSKYLAIGLKMLGQLYFPIISWLEFYDDEFVRLKPPDDPNTPINRLKQLSQDLKILADKQEGWINFQWCGWFKYKLISETQYYFCTLHAENVKLDENELQFLKRLEANQNSLRPSLMMAHKNLFLEVQFEVSYFWTLFFQQRPTFDQLCIVMQKSEVAIVNFLKQNSGADKFTSYIRIFQSSFMFMALITFYLKVDRWIDFLKSPQFQYGITLPNNEPGQVVLALLQFLNYVQQIEMALYVTNILDEHENSELVKKGCKNIYIERQVFSAIFSIQENNFTNENYHPSMYPYSYLKKILEKQKQQDSKIYKIIKKMENQEFGLPNDEDDIAEVEPVTQHTQEAEELD